MHATIHRFRRWPGEESEEWGRTLLATLLDGMQPVGTAVLSRLDGMDGAVIALWHDEIAATAAGTRPGNVARWLDASVYRVITADPGVAAGETSRFAQLVWLNGSGDADRADAAMRAGRERIGPAARAVEGVVCTYVLRAEDSSLVAVTLVAGVEVPEALRRAILATELLPWEDPAHLTGPDRIDIDRVLVAHLPQNNLMEVRS